MNLAGVWGNDGTILVPATLPAGPGVGLGRLSAAGGPLSVVIEPRSGEIGIVLPRLLPGGDHVLYAGGSLEGGGVFVDSLTTPGRSQLVGLNFARNRTNLVPNLAYAEGFLLYPRDTTLMVQPFDAGARALRGEAQPIAENVREWSVGAGTLVYLETDAAGANGAPEPTRRLIWLDRGGQRLGEVATPPGYRLPVLSRDGRRIALSVPASGSTPGNPSYDIWTIDTERDTTTRLTFDAATDDVPVWSPDDTRIVFNSGRDGMPGLASSLYERAANGTGSDQRLYSAAPDEFLVPLDWSRDGSYLVLARSRLSTWQQRADLWVLEMSGERTASPLIESPFVKGSAKFSPDGRWIAYFTNESNGNQIVVQPFPDVGRGKWQISTRGGNYPHWRDDGRELYYLDPDGILMAVDVQTDGDAFEAGPPRPLFATGLAAARPGETPDFLYDVTTDGERFLINEPLPGNTAGALDLMTPPTAQVKVILNWTAGLETR
jgi:dipeptidyl aminopeptidase/acylaminoacyl peptidase